jgi:hypothetical protein
MIAPRGRVEFASEGVEEISNGLAMCAIHHLFELFDETDAA